MRWLDRLRLAWRLAARVPAMPTEVPAWEADDAKALAAFLRSETGVKLGTTLRHLIVTQSIAAVSDGSERLSWRCGHASGVRWMAETLDGMARWESEKPAPKDDRPSDNLTWLHGNGDDDNDRNE